MDLHGRSPGAGVWVVQSARAVPVPLPVGLANLHPVILSIFGNASLLERRGEKLTEVVIVGRVLEAEVAHICQIRHQLLGETLAQLLDGRRLLLLTNLLVLLLISSSLKTLPGKTTAQKVHEYVAKGLEIVSSRLLATKMGVDTHVTSSARKRLAFAVGNVLLRLGVTVLLGHTEIDHVDDIRSLGVWPADEEVIGLDITVDQVLLVDGLDAGQHLLGDHDNRLEGESPVAVVEKILERWTEKIDHQDVVQTFLAKVVHIWDASCDKVSLRSFPPIMGGHMSTYGTRRGFCMSCTHLSVGGHRSFLVPAITSRQHLLLPLTRCRIHVQT